MRLSLDASTLPALALGCSVFGTGGGGDPAIGLLMALQAVEDFGPVPLMGLDELPAEGLLMPCGMIGAPTVHIEKFENGEEGRRLRDEVERLWGRPVVALMCAELGGSNGLLPIAWSARMGLPLVDADGMGRAFPEVPQVTMHLAGISPSPGVMTDERGNLIVFRPLDGRWMERLARAAAVELGGSAASAEYCLTVAEAAGATVQGSLSRAIEVGRAVREAEHDPVEALVGAVGAFRLIEGKVSDVERRTTRGFVRGSVVIEGLAGDTGRLLRLEIQNENLIALEAGRMLASVPDLISVVDSETADAIATERVRYGQRVTVVAFPCDPIWRSPSGLEMVGPRAFGYDIDYVPVEELADATA